MEEVGAGGGHAASHCLCSALNARPAASQGYAPAAARRMGKELVVEEKKGDIFKEVTMGTFLTRLDNYQRPRLTPSSL
jgi:hypothetical protein